MWNDCITVGIVLSRRDVAFTDAAMTKANDVGGPRSSSRPLFPSFASYSVAFVARDLVAGLTLAAIAIPEQMATARLGGFEPQIGFFAFIAGSLAFAAFGASRYLSSGADSTITPIFAGSLGLIAAVGSPNYLGLAATLALMVGAILVIGGLCRLGWIANLLSMPITVGFLAGIAAHIVISQLPPVLGVAEPAGPMLERLATLARGIGGTNPYTVALGIGVLAIILISERIDARIPGALIGLVAATLVVVFAGLERHGVAVLGVVPASMPTPQMPDISYTQFQGLVPLAAIITVVIMVQTAATTRSFQADPDDLPDVNRDFIGVGAGSILAAFVGAFPVDASPPRTAIVAQTGGRSQLSGLVAAAIVLALIVAGAALLRHVPQAALAGVLFFVAYRIVRVRQAAGVYRQSISEFLLIVATAAAIVVLPIEQGVGLGIALSLLHGIWTATRARVTVLERVPGTSIWWPPSPKIKGERIPGIVVVGFSAPLSFLNAYDFRSGIMKAMRTSTGEARLLVLEATGIVELDVTAGEVLIACIRECHDNGVDFAIARLESIRAQEAMTRLGLDQVLGPDRLFHSVAEAVRALGGASGSKDASAGKTDAASGGQA